MTVKREDLLAAATAGILHYGEIDPLLIFLAQREATIRKSAAPNEQPLTSWKGFHWIAYLGGVLAISLVTLVGMLFSMRGAVSLGLMAVLWFSLVYALCAIGATAWFNLRAGSVPIGLFAVLVIALMPVGVFALQRLMGW